ncbi:MAG TPA: hypothetical protein VMM13_16725 [Euzebya sp.]|nr:hypothetical protein [Euzebya sp.]
MPSLPTITDVAQALLITLGVDQAVTVLLSQFDWDRVFVALSHIEEPDGCHAMWVTLGRMAG